MMKEKGTNRSAFFRGEVDKYSWVDIGSSFLPSDIIAAFLFAQLEQLNTIQSRRREIWNNYDQKLRNNLVFKEKIRLPNIPKYATNNAHMYYIVCSNKKDRQGLLKKLKDNGVLAVFHYLSLHKSTFYKDKYKGEALPLSDHYSDCLIRLPLYYDLGTEDQNKVINLILDFFYKNI